MSVPCLCFIHHHCPSVTLWTRPGLPFPSVKDQILWTAHLMVTQNVGWNFFKMFLNVPMSCQERNSSSEAKNKVKAELRKDGRACLPPRGPYSWWHRAPVRVDCGGQVAGDEPSGRSPCKQLDSQRTAFSLGGSQHWLERRAQASLRIHLQAFPHVGLNSHGTCDLNIFPVKFLKRS